MGSVSRTGCNFATTWEAIADDAGDQPALFHAGTERSWSEFEGRSARLAGAFVNAGVGPADNVACALYTGRNTSRRSSRRSRSGRRRATSTTGTSNNELAYLVDNSDAAAVVFDAALAERFDRIHQRLDKVRLWVQVGNEACPRLGGAI